MVHIEIDGITLEVPQGSMIIEAADKVGISIPRFCYHKKLSIAANCRMCLVDVEKAPKPLPACATPVSEGMKINTQSMRAKLAQKAVMEFLLINHPLDCPICDQGGQCELQDVAMMYGSDVSKFNEGKRAVNKKNIGPLIETDMTRCIHCTRCVRFGEEVAGVREMGATGRGEFTEIGTYIESSVDSELSGNIIDLCPVGALTSKPFRYRARAWEVQAHPSVAMHDSMGSNIYYHSQHGKILRVVPRENEQANEVWLSDRDRFSYESFYHPERLQQPLIKVEGKWKEVDWPTVLQFAVDKLKSVEQTHGAEQLGCFMSPNCTTEEFYLAQKLMRDKNCPNIDHRLRQTDFGFDDFVGKAPGLGLSLEDIQTQDAIFIIGANVRKEQPLLNARIRNAHEGGQGAKVFSLSPMAFEHNFDHDIEIIGQQSDIQLELAAILKSAINQKQANVHQDVSALLKDVQVNEQAEQIAQGLHKANKSTIILGQYCINHPHASMLYWLSNLLARVCGSTWGEISFGANSAGGWLAGAIPNRGAFAAKTKPGMSAFDMCKHPRKGLLLMQCEPELDFASPRLALEAMHAAEAVVALSTFDSKYLREYADCILPITPVSETDGTLINSVGAWQSFTPAVKPYEQSKPGWKVLRVLGELWGCGEVLYNSQAEILAELKELYENMHHFEPTFDKMPCPKAIHDITPERKLVRLAPVPLYHADGLVRRAASLQKTRDANVNYIQIHPNTAKGLNLNTEKRFYVKQDEKSTEIALPVFTNTAVPENVVVIPLGLEAVTALGSSYGLVELEPA